jgi:hypothetical protein
MPALAFCVWLKTSLAGAGPLCHTKGVFHMRYQIVGANIDTWLINVKGKLPDGLTEELDFLKEAAQEADDDIPTRWTFAGETLFIRAHGSGRQWR